MKKLTLICITILLPYVAFSHGYWLETEGTGKVGEEVKVYLVYGEYASDKRENGERLDKMADILVSVIAPDGQKQDLKMSQTHTRWEGGFVPLQEGVYQIIGINDSRGVQDWHKHKLGITRPVQYVRTHFVVGTTNNLSSKNIQFLDIIPTSQGEFVAITAYLDGKPMANASIKIINPHTWEKTLLSNDRGRVTFFPPVGGMYLAEIEWIDKTPGEFKGKAYETIRYKSETSIFINQ